MRDLYMTDTAALRGAVQERAGPPPLSPSSPWVDTPHGFLGSIVRGVYDGNKHK